MLQRKIRVLIIDDEKGFCFFVKKNLELIPNFEVITATNGKEGLHAAHWRKPDVVLLDVMMPGISGFEVLKQLKDNKKTFHIPVIMLSAKGDDESKEKAAYLYDEEYLVKPVELMTLKAKIEEVLARREGGKT